METVMNEEYVPDIWVSFFASHPVFARCKDVKMHVKVAGELIDCRYGDEDSWGKKMVATFAQTPSEVLKMLAEDKNKFVRLAVAGNKACLTEVLSVLEKDGWKDIIASVAGNEATSIETLEILAEDEDSNIRWNVAGNRMTPEHVLRRLLDDESQLVRNRVIGNMGLSKDILNVLSSDKDREVRSNARLAVAEREDTEGDTLRDLAMSADGHLGAIARNRNTPEDVLRDLARQPSEQVREAVVCNSNASEELVCSLARDPSPDIRCFVAYHARLPLAELAKLEHDENEKVRLHAKKMLMLRTNPLIAPVNLSGLARNIQSTEEYNDAITILFENWLEGLGCSQAVHDLLWRLVPLHYGFYMPSLLQRPMLPEYMLRKYASVRDWRNRWLVAMHLRTPEDVRERLRWDGNRVVRVAARGVFARWTG